MKATKFRGTEERAVLIGMIVNSRVLGKIYAALPKGHNEPFRAKWSNIIGRWCLTYFLKYGEAPKKSIESLFRKFAEKSSDEETVHVIEKFLSSLSEQYESEEPINEDFLVDTAARYFNEVRMEKLCRNVEANLERHAVEEAQKDIATYHPVQLSAAKMVEVYSDRDAIKDALREQDNDVLIRYPGKLGEFFGPHLKREGFISFMGPEKVGKSFWLIDMAWRASVFSRRRTLLYSVGDMSQREMLQRIIARACHRPLRAGVIEKPVGLKREDGKAIVKTKEIAFREGLSYREAKQRMIDDVSTKTGRKESLLRMRCTSNNSTRVADIRADIDELIRREWVPDVVIIDYADILLEEEGSSSTDYRHKINAQWQAMRRLSQDYHVLLVTATQADAASYDQQLIRKKNFSEDKRKLSHVTGLIGINQIEEEKENGIYRLNWILLREGHFYESKCITTASCLSIANPAVESCW